ncbi:MAG TPA: DUF427 domain-containing protein [Candidatus Polarisedimenticolia bacterium]|nr:DUF427 domain-containing protein [Candidatus Polarisedimenticolia bacterium]
MRYQAKWNGAVIADSDETVVVEGNQYFPVEAVVASSLQPSQTHTTCHWKGLASYYDVVVDGKVNADAAWYYPEPSDAAANIKDRVAFWHGVKVEPAP